MPITCPYCHNDDKRLLSQLNARTVAPGIVQVWMYCENCSKEFSTTIGEANITKSGS